VTGLPPIDQSLIPADIRKGSATDKKTYQAALGFERMLVGEMTKVMADTAQPAGSDGGDSSDSSSDSTGGSDSSAQPQDAASSMYMQMLPDQLADAVTAGGGLGLARGFYQSMKERS
jgi:Rod binding domain-containing protein